MHRGWFPVGSLVAGGFLACVASTTPSSQQGPAAGDGSQGSMLIGPAGGTLSLADGSSITIPAGALSTATEITMAPAPGSPFPGGGISGVPGYELGPEGLTFAVPATVTLSFSPLALPAGAETSDLTMLTAPVGVSDYAYSMVTSVVDPTHISAQTSHFSWVWIAADNTVAAGQRLTTTGAQGVVCFTPGCALNPPADICAGLNDSCACDHCNASTVPCCGAGTCNDGTCSMGGGGMDAGGADGGACDPNNPMSKTADHGYICIGKDQACDGTTLPCCTDECSDQLGVPHDSTETLVCDTQRGNPSATGNCEDTLTPGGTNDAGMGGTPDADTPDALVNDDPCGMGNDEWVAVWPTAHCPGAYPSPGGAIYPYGRFMEYMIPTIWNVDVQWTGPLFEALTFHVASCTITAVSSPVAGGPVTNTTYDLKSRTCTGEGVDNEPAPSYALFTCPATCTSFGPDPMYPLP